jgi:hypothetical protein
MMMVGDILDDPEQRFCHDRRRGVLCACTPPVSPQLCLRATTERRCGHQFDCGKDQSLVVVSILADIRGSKGDRDMGRKWLELVGQYKCECGAIYKQIATQTPFTDTDYADCEVCGARMDSWRNSTSSRSYELLSRPE